MSEQTDQTTPGTDVSEKRTHRAVYRRRSVARGGEVGSAEPGPLPVQVHVCGKLDLILLKAVMNVSMYKLGGNRPQGAIKGAFLHTLNTHHLEASLSLHALMTCTP